MVNRIFIIILCLFNTFCLGKASAEPLSFGNKKVQVSINKDNGRILSYRQLSGGKWEDVPFRTDSMGGFGFEGVDMVPLHGSKLAFVGHKQNIEYKLIYGCDDDHLLVKCIITNNGRIDFSPKRLRLRIGIDAEMHTYPQWNNKYFPTLMRCEKNFAWGYFMSPLKNIIGVGVEQPVASYALNYIYEDVKWWMWGHQIRTASFDLLHCLPLPERHPKNLTTLKSGETKTWTVHIGGVKNLASVKSNISKWINAPLIESEKYTLLPGERTSLTFFSTKRISRVEVVSPDKSSCLLYVGKPSAGKYKVMFKGFTSPGAYTIHVLSDGKQAEGKIYVRRQWSWYMKKARDFAAVHPPFMGSSCETFYGYYAAFIGAANFPDTLKDNELRRRFDEALPLMIDTVTGLPKNEQVLPRRIQNFSSIIGMLVDLWKATNNTRYLEYASRVGDYLCCDSVQWRDGSYRSKTTHYTAVIYPAKSMMELAVAEKSLADKSSVWKERYERHFLSASRAADDLVKRLDDIETEGDMTLEDGMVTCSALQIGLLGLHQRGAKDKQRYAEAASYMMNKHLCLEQNLIPDCRMHGATLRYWEALDLYFSPNQVMNSPHGWTAWKIYADYYLYLLTGKKNYLKDFMETMGTCCQVMDLNGKLRWGFMPDPYDDGLLCVPDADSDKGWKTKPAIVGEQYMDLISPWLRSKDDKNVLCFFGGKGGAGDNTVYEIFKAMGEVALNSAYVFVDKNKEITAYNCEAKWRKDGCLYVSPAEAIVTGVNINSELNIDVITKLKGKTVGNKNVHSMKWIGSVPSLIK
jgi:hypothetical protein